MKNSKKEKNIQNMIWCIFFLISSILILKKCKYGIPDVDESFYLTIPHRLLQGDGLFIHEWHLSQMSSVLVLPFVWIYETIAGTTDGIFLFMRYTACILMILAGIYIYVRLKKINQTGAAVASVVFTLYIPFGISALSYNSLGILMLVLSLVTVVTAEHRKELSFILSGIFLSGAVLCNPYLALLYVVYMFYIIIRRISKKQKPNTCEINNTKGAFMLSVGVMACAALFCLFVFSRTSFQDLFRSMEGMFSDPEHAYIPFTTKIITYFTSILNFGKWITYLHYGFLLLFIICILDKKRMEHKLPYFGLSVLLSVVLLISLFVKFHYINFVIWPINFIIPFIYILDHSAWIKKIFWIVWVPGMFYSFCMHCTSNQHIYVIASGSVVAAVGSILLLFLFTDHLRKKGNKKNPWKIGMIGISAVWILLLGEVRYTNIFWDEPIRYQTEYMETGLCKGIYASPEKKEIYETSVENRKVVEKYRPDKVLYLSELTWYYLIGDHEFSTFSAWCSGVDHVTLDRLKLYYEINPDKLPDVVFAEDEYKEIAKEFCDQFEYHMAEEKPIVLTKNGKDRK